VLVAVEATRRGGTDARRRRATMLAAACVLCLMAWAPASSAAAQLKLEALTGGRVQARIDGQGASRRLEFALAGRQPVRTRRRSAVFRFAPRGRAAARWRRIEVRAARSGRVLARSRFALAAGSDRSAPTILITRAPRGSTASVGAVIRFSVAGARARCRLDGARFRRCGSPVTYPALSEGRHSFVVRARNRHGRARIRVSWTRAQTAPGGSQPTPGPTAPTPLPPVPAGWKLVFEDTFSGTSLNTGSWSPYNSPGHSGNGLRRPSALTLDGAGNLVVTAAMSNDVIVSGGMSHRGNYRYGRFEFRVRTEVDPSGTTSGVILTWPQSENWPEDGENDIYETGNSKGTRSPFKSFVHYGATNEQYWFHHDADGAQWHTMAMEWTETAITIYRDGALVWTITDQVAIPDVPHHLAIQLDAITTTPLTAPVRMYVDYVRIYQ
jgi:hypothetical protein